MPTDCRDLGPTMTLPFGGAKPSGISVDLLSESYNANWSKPALDVGKHRLRVHASVFVAGLRRQATLGFVDLQVVSKKKEPVDAGFIPVGKGSPIPVKFRIETRTIGGLIG